MVWAQCAILQVSLVLSLFVVRVLVAPSQMTESHFGASCELASIDGTQSSSKVWFQLSQRNHSVDPDFPM